MVPSKPYLENRLKIPECWLLFSPEMEDATTSGSRPRQFRRRARMQGLLQEVQVGQEPLSPHGDLSPGSHQLCNANIGKIWYDSGIEDCLGSPSAIGFCSDFVAS